MKQLITTDLGGHPIKYKDFEFLQEQIRELVNATFGQLDWTKVTVLRGCTITVSSDGYTITVTDGFAFYNGFYYHVPAHSITGTTPQVAKWIVAYSYDSRGLKTFKDTSQKNVYKIDELKLAFVNSADTGVAIADTIMSTKKTDWVTVTNLPTGWNVHEPIMYRLNSNGDLQIKGKCYMDDSTESVGFVLPVGFRPQKNTIIPVAKWGPAPTDVWYVTINANGEFLWDIATMGFILNHTIILD